MTPLQTCPVDRGTPFLCLRHGQAPNARPPTPKLPQPRVDLVHVAEGVRRKNKATILAQYRQTGISQDIL